MFRHKKHMDKVIEELHQEYHKAERRVEKKFNIVVTQNERSLGLGAYLSCAAIAGFQKDKPDGGGLRYNE